MSHIIGSPEERDATLREQVFPSIAAGNTILFLGAGASVTDEKKFLSAHLMEYHRAKEGFDFETTDITEYIDVLTKNPRFDRRKFDDQVAEYLRRLQPAQFHSTIARLPWKEIITTNYDLLLERAHDSLRGTHNEDHKLIVVNDPQGYHYRPAADEVVYVKLNGCISDLSAYPLVFSSADFERAKRFYQVVLQALENLSPKIQFLSIGYSFSDPFAQALLKRFDRFNYRNRREMLLVDPLIQGARLPALTESRIRAIKSTTAEFFSAYQLWEEQADESLLRRRPVSFKTSDNRRINIPAKLSKRLADQVVQLGRDMPSSVRPEDFYRGERPSFYVVEKGYDVVRSGLLADLRAALIVALHSDGMILPIVALTGGYGTGKSTLGYRLIYELLRSDLDVIALEVINPLELRVQDLKELLERSSTENVVFLFDECEVDSSYKALVNLQVELSALQLTGINIAFIVPIRENILQKFQSKRNYSSLNALRADAPMTLGEIIDLFNKLESSNVIHFSDISERNRRAREAIDNYGGDPFVTLLSLVTAGRYELTLQHAYAQLSPASQRAFLLTSLLYRYKLYMPASLLMRLVSSDWDDFKRDVMEVDTMGILIQVERTVKGTDPDLYFRTRHSVISDLLVKFLLPSPDAQFNEYIKILRKMHYSSYSSRLVVDLLKALREDEDFSDTKVGALFDACAPEFAADPHFNLHYAINLQYRNTEEALRRGIDRLIYAEGFLVRRNHRLTHRRAVLTFRLAKMLKDGGLGNEAVGAHVQKARELFAIKLIEDPFSSYSFIEYIRFEVWCLESNANTDSDRVFTMVRIADLFDKARRRLREDHDKVAGLEASYRAKQAAILGREEIMMSISGGYTKTLISGLTL